MRRRSWKPWKQSRLPPLPTDVTPRYCLPRRPRVGTGTSNEVFMQIGDVDGDLAPHGYSGLVTPLSILDESSIPVKTNRPVSRAF